MKQVGLLLLVTVVVTAERVLYTGYHSLVVEGINTLQDVQLIQTLVDREERLRKVMLMNDDVLIGNPALLLVAPDWVESVTSALNQANMQIKVLNTDHQAAIDKADAENDALRKRAKKIRDLRAEGDIDHYMTYEEIVAYIDQEARANIFVTSEVIGTTFENREIPAMSILSAGAAKNSVYLDSGAHAREWLSIATNLWVANEIILGSTPESLYLKQNFNWYIVPMVNPDGYVYTWDTNREWRKTRTSLYSTDANCYGVDSNRQWATPGWNTNGAPCTNNYAGPAAFSEPSTSAVRNYIQDKLTNHNLILSINFHAYSQFMLMPTGYMSTRIDEYDEVYILAQRTTTGIYQAHQKIYLSDTLYERAQGYVYGTQSDYVYSIGLPYSYTIEVRPEGDNPNGFVMPPSEIQPTGQEILHGLYRALEPGSPAI